MGTVILHIESSPGNSMVGAGGLSPFSINFPGNRLGPTQTHDWILYEWRGYIGTPSTEYISTGGIGEWADDQVIGVLQPVTMYDHGYEYIAYYFKIHNIRPAGSIVIKYLGNGATGGSTASNFAVYGSNFTFQANGFTRTGYTFFRWDLHSNNIGYENSYNAGQTIEWFRTGDYTAKASWSPNLYTIYYYMSGGEDGGTTEENTARYGSNFTFQVNGFTKTGYTFYRWLVRDNNYSFIGYYNEGQLYGIWDRLSNHHAYASWTVKKYTVTYDANGGSGTLATNPQEATYDSSFTFQASNGFTRIGYTFSKWDLYESNGTTRLNKEYASGQSYGTWNIPYNIIAKATWNADSYTVTFDRNGKGTGKTVTQSVGTTVTCPTLKAVGYVFGGWAISATSTTVNKEGNATFVLGAANQTFFAIWTENTNGSVSFSELQTVYGGINPIGISEYRTESGQTTANSKIALSADFKGKGPAP